MKKRTKTCFYEKILAYFLLLIAILCILSCIWLAIEIIMASNMLQAANASGHEYLPCVIVGHICAFLLLIGTICFLLFLLLMTTSGQ